MGYPNTNFSELLKCTYYRIPEIASALPTSVEEKLNPPYALSLSAHRENTCKYFLILITKTMEERIQREKDTVI
jgi:hypothetical protein